MKNPRPRLVVLAVAGAALTAWVVFTPGPAHSHPTGWAWPLSEVGIQRGYLAPAEPFGPGHRGIDLISSPGQRILAPAEGVITFAGVVANVPVVTIDHGNGWLTSYEPASTSLAKGTRVRARQALGVVAPGISHCSCLHFGARVNGQYVSPLLLVGEVPPAVLMPW